MEGRILYTTADEEWGETPFPLSPAELLSLTAATPHAWFMKLTPAGLVEFRTAPIQPTDDDERITPAQGWFIAARLWNDAFLAEVGRALGGTVALHPVDEPPAAAPLAPGSLQINHEVRDENDALVAWIRLNRMSDELRVLFEADNYERIIVIVFGLLVLGVVAFALQHWVIRPLGAISTSLERSTTADQIAADHGSPEWQRVAALVDSWFSQKQRLEQEVDQRNRIAEELKISEIELRRNIEERIRLGRDLHDSVIQSVYAAGMGLAGARHLLRTEPGEAENRLEAVQRRLNETIRELRHFITGLEPEHSTSETFAEAVEDLVGFLQAIGPLQADIDIDEDAADTLTPFARDNALHIIREALSNALRHGGADHILLELAATDAGVAMIIEDNGRGFVDTKASGPGLGLTNMRERAAAVDATLEITSTPTKGTRLHLTFKIPPAA